VLWEGYSEALDDGKHRVFGYTPNYLRVGCVIGNDLSVENKILNCRITALGENSVVGELEHL
jgi:threonylcarbamoyladenosine tRNA methylthiotransferase MtaB